MNYIRKYKLASRVLHNLGKRFIGDTAKWDFGNGIHVSSEEFYMLPEDRPIANPMLRLERGKWEMMVRNTYVDYIRRKVMQRVAITMTAISIAVVAVSFSGAFVINQAGDAITSIKEASAQRKANKEKIEELEETLATLKESHAAGQMPKEQFEIQYIQANEQLMRLSNPKKFEKYEEQKEALYREEQALQQQLFSQTITRAQFDEKAKELKERMNKLQFGE